MVRTYWAPKGQDWEFLGAFPAGHVVRDVKQPQGMGHVLDISDLDVRGANEKLQVETRPAPPRIVGAPTAMTKRLQARAPYAITWAQLEGYVK
jgi:hypothetical protein